MEDGLASATKQIESADALLITAGAGIGVDSGLPDFRGDAGFWKAYPPLQKLGISFQQMANPDWFRRDPELAWGFYGHRLQLYRETTPHDGFSILHKWAERKPAGWFVFTSNVDGQFQTAGFDPARVVERHGSVHHLQCQSRSGIWSADGATISIDTETLRALTFPECRCCSRAARPNILMFGDSRWDASRSDEQHRLMRVWLRNLPTSARLAVIEIGAGANISTVRNLSEDIASRRNAALIRINPREPDGPAGTISLRMGALTALQVIEDRLQGGS